MTFAAGLLHIFVTVVLHDTLRAARDQELRLPRECCHRCIPGVVRAVYPDGSNSASFVQAVSLYSWTQPRLLGTQLLGISHSIRSYSPSLYVLCLPLVIALTDVHPSDIVAKKTGLGIPINQSGVASTSRGLVGDTVFAVIPNVKPIHTFTITLMFQSVSRFSVDSPVGYEY